MEPRLSFVRFKDEALDEFRDIWLRNFGEEISRDRANEEANNMYRLFDHLGRIQKEHDAKVREENKLTENEEKALAFIQEFKETNGKMPTVRAISRHLGFSSSRTGYRIRQVLIRKGHSFLARSPKLQI